MPLPDPGPGFRDHLVAVVRERTQLRITERNRDALVQHALEQLAKRQLPAGEYLDSLTRGADGDTELESIVRELTVGETYFFRGPHFATIRNIILPELVARRGHEPRPSLRVLSAGCASGEEAYSLAMTLIDALPDLERWNVRILGLDINTAFLRRAQVGAYRPWSFRGVDARIQDRYFEEHDGVFALDPLVKERVQFRYANLAMDPLPAPSLGLVGMDVILCQNVVYYFEPEAKLRVAEKLARMLTPSGYLLFGPADLLDAPLPGCTTLTSDDLFGYQRTRPSIVPPAVRKKYSRPEMPAVREIPKDWVPPPRPEAPPAPRPPVGPAAPAEPPLTWELARALADEGDVEAAIRAAEALLGRNREDARGHAIHGFLLAEANRLEGALQAFRRSLYLEPSSLLANAGAAMTARRLGQDDLLRRFNAKVRALASDQAEDLAVDGWKGMTAGRLLRLFDKQPGGDS